MGWAESIGMAINYIEEHICEELTPEMIAEKAAVSPFYFQKGFAMLCGMSIAEYIRGRRLSLAGREVLSTDRRIIDIAMDYGYDSPDSFTKAFTRFHGVTPAAVRKEGGGLRPFAPLKLKISLEGGSIMNCKIVKKPAFTVLCTERKFSYEEAPAKVPQFWSEHMANGGAKTVHGNYGINIDESMGCKEFSYLIADDFAGGEVPAGFKTRVIPEFTWAVFPITGSMPEAIQAVEKQIFSEWLPNNGEYEIAAGYNVEMYSDPTQYAGGTRDKAYYSEVWIPVKEAK